MAYSHSVNVSSGVPILVANPTALLKMKKQANREKDATDIALLETFVPGWETRFLIKCQSPSYALV